MNDIGMTLVELARLRRMAVALLGDRQRDDARGGIGHARDQMRGVCSRHLGLKHRADNPVFGTRARANGYRIEAILRGEGIARVATSKACTDDSPIG